MDNYYVQLDSFSRELVKDYEGSMKKVAQMGYRGIEIYYGLHGGYSPKELKEFLASIGMEVLGSHVEPEDTDRNLNYLPETGCRYLVCPGIAITSYEEAIEASKTLNEMGRKAKSVGMRYAYHNHGNDFLDVDGKKINDILIENTDPELVTFEIDLAWAYRAGTDAAEYIRNHLGRFELIHVKETKKFPFEMRISKGRKPRDDERDASGWPKMTEEQWAEMEKGLSVNCQLGSGLVDMKAVKAAADLQSFSPYYIVEREYAWTRDIFTTLAADAGYMKAL